MAPSCIVEKPGLEGAKRGARIGFVLGSLALVTILAGSASGSVTVGVIGDGLDESFTVSSRVRPTPRWSTMRARVRSLTTTMPCRSTTWRWERRRG